MEQWSVGLACTWAVVDPLQQIVKFRRSSSATDKNPFQHTQKNGKVGLTRWVTQMDLPNPLKHPLQFFMQGGFVKSSVG